MTATQFTARANDALTYIDDVVPLSDADAPLFAELYQVLSRHGALKRFGITLLHQHFEISGDEVMLERTDVKQRKQVISPVKITELQNRQVIETSWRLDSGAPMMRCACYQQPTNVHDHVYWPEAGDDE
jgi:hypothetical protein